MSSFRKIALLVLLPVLLLIGLSAFVFYRLGAPTARQAAQREVDAAAQLTSVLIDRHLRMIDDVVRITLAQQFVEEYAMLARAGLVEQAEDMRLYIENTWTTLAESDPNYQKLELFDRSGQRLVAIIDGRRTLKPLNVAEEPWFQTVIDQRDFAAFEPEQRVRLARAGGIGDQPDSDTLMVVSVVYAARDRIADSAEFATRHISGAEVSLQAPRISPWFLHDEQLAAAVPDFRGEASLERTDGRVVVRQAASEALALFRSAARTLLVALVIVIGGLLGTVAVGAMLVVRSEREAQRQTDVAYRQLRREQFLLTSLADSVPDVVFFKDLDGRFIRVNQALASLAEVSGPADLIGKKETELWPSLGDTIDWDDRKIVASGEPLVNRQQRVERSDGSERWLLLTRMPLLDEHDEVCGTFGVARDITDEKRRELALRDSEARFRTIVENAPEAVVLLDVSNGRFCDANQNAEQLFGLEREELLQKHPAEVSPSVQPDGRPSDEAAGYEIERALDGERPVFEWTHHDAQGRPIPCEVRLVRLPAADCQLIRASITDISHRKQAEEALRLARDDAEAASRAKSDFLATMSHEIRTPLNAVIVMTELVLDSQLDSTQREYLEIVHDAGESLLSVINDILDFSKIEAGKLELDQQTFDVADHLGNTVKVFAARAHAKNLELNLRIDPEIPERLVGDAGRLRQIVTNLVGNAIKFTSEGEIDVELKLADPSSNGAPGHDSEVALHVTVSDTGPGIPEDRIGHVFEAFEQADMSITREHGGTGLGLAIAAQLVQLMGGRIWVTSQLGQGSQFHFTAVLRRAGDEPMAASRTGPEVLEGTRVLVVDDNATNRKILVELLQHWKITAVAVAGTDEALDALRTAVQQGVPFAFVLSDLHMPGRDGFQLAAEMQNDPQLAETSFILLGSAASQGGARREPGIAATLMKPIKRSELLATMLEAARTAATTDVRALARKPIVSADDSPCDASLEILLAEDSIPNQKLAVGLLGKWGHTVTVAGNGREALDHYRERRFDLILMDLQMPEMDGFEATGEIRKLEQINGRRTPIVALTAHALKGNRQACLDAGMDEMVTKPIRQSVLKQVIRDLSHPSS